MKLLPVFAFLFCFGLSRAQGIDTNYVFIPNTFLTEGGPLLKWETVLPKTFSFHLYNRWGELLFEETKDPRFVIYDFIGGKKLPEATPCMFVLECVMPDGTQFRVQRSVLYMGFYCAG